MSGNFVIMYELTFAMHITKRKFVFILKHSKILKNMELQNSSQKNNKFSFVS